MRKISSVTCLLLSITLSISALDFNETRTEHYHVRTTLSPEATAQLGFLMEELYARFSRFTGEPVEKISGLYVTALSSEAEFQELGGSSFSSPAGDFLLMRQGISGSGEILFYGNGSRESTEALIHLALFQYLEACNSETPFWIKAGLARYFETLAEQAEGGSASPPFNWNAYEEWTTLSKEDSLPINALLDLTEGKAIGNSLFHNTAWALVSYLIQASGEEGRLLWETLSLIRTGKKGEWISSVSTPTDDTLLFYMSSIKKPESHSAVLKALYAKDDRAGIVSYLDNNKLSETWLGFYYKGLLHYDRGLFEEGLSDFRKAEETGAPLADTLYSQGLCLWELGKRQEGETLLRRAEKLKEDIIPDDLNRLLD